MTQEEKQLLLVDLCARLPYGVKVKFAIPALLVSVRNDRDGIKVITESTYSEHIYNIEDIKPYLHPLSTMTEEEKKEFIEYAGYEIEESVNGRHHEYYLKDFCGTPDNPSVNADGIDWLNKKMFDYRGLIDEGLAISTKEFNPYKD